MKIKIFLLLLPLLLLGCGKKSISTISKTSPNTFQTNNSSQSTTNKIEIDNYQNKYDGVNYYVTDEIEYYSTVTSSTKHAYLTLPYNYDSNKKYPVLYLLHGLMQTHKSWVQSCKADIILSNLVYSGSAKEMIIVSANSLCTNNESNPSLADAAIIYDKTKEDLISSLIPYIESNYSVEANKENRAIAGYSMGGREALLTAFTYQEYFDYIGAFSSASMYMNIISNSGEKAMDDFIVDKTKGGFKKILLTKGKSDFMTNDNTDTYDKMMTKNNINHEFIKMNGGHDYSVWSNSIEMFMKDIF